MATLRVCVCVYECIRVCAYKLYGHSCVFVISIYIDATDENDFYIYSAAGLFALCGVCVCAGTRNNRKDLYDPSYYYEFHPKIS